MTRQSVKETATNVVIPSTVAIGILAIVAQALGVIPQREDIDDPLRSRIIAIEARQVEMDRQNREDRNAILVQLMEISGAVRRLEGKLEK